MTYQPGIPTGSVPLNQDYLNLQANFTQINSQFQVDHVPLTSTSGSPPNGYHTVVHLVPFSTTASNPPNNQPVVSPTTTGGIGQLFSSQINDGINNDEAFYFQTGGGRILQMTRNFSPKNATNGYTFLPGGLIMQWGIVAGSSSATITVTFATSNIAFPTACYNVSVTAVRPASSPGSDFATVVVNGSVSKTGFQIGNIGGHTINNWYWTAIGN
jgi:hypothetical protein